MNGKNEKEHNLFETEIFCNIYKCLYCPFWSGYAALLNKSYFKKHCDRSMRKHKAIMKNFDKIMWRELQ